MLLPDIINLTHRDMEIARDNMDIFRKAGFVLEKSKNMDIEQNMQIERNLSAPISKGQKIGELSFSLNGEVLSTVDVVAKEDVEKINLFTMSKKVVYSWVDLLRS